MPKNKIQTAKNINPDKIKTIKTIFFHRSLKDSTKYLYNLFTSLSLSFGLVIYSNKIKCIFT